MIGQLNHIAIAVPNLEEAANVYRNILGAKVTDPVALPEHGVTTVFVELPNTKIELLEALGDDSPIAGFIDRNPKGGMHHICLEVEDIMEARDKLIAEGAHLRRAASLQGCGVAQHVPTSSANEHSFALHKPCKFAFFTMTAPQKSDCPAIASSQL